MSVIEEQQVVMTGELSTDCECSYYDEETGTEVASYDECFGCYNENLDNLKFGLFEAWLLANRWERDTPIIVQGTKMGWRGVSGHAITTPYRLVDTLGLNGDYTLRFTLKGKDLSVIRSSHDEPTGASFTISLFVEDEESEEERY